MDRWGSEPKPEKPRYFGNTPAERRDGYFAAVDAVAKCESNLTELLKTKATIEARVWLKPRRISEKQAERDLARLAEIEAAADKYRKLLHKAQTQVAFYKENHQDEVWNWTTRERRENTSF